MQEYLTFKLPNSKEITIDVVDYNNLLQLGVMPAERWKFSKNIVCVRHNSKDIHIAKLIWSELVEDWTGVRILYYDKNRLNLRRSNLVLDGKAAPPKVKKITMITELA
jgi:hypothetical protein